MMKYLLIMLSFALGSMTGLSSGQISQQFDKNGNLATGYTQLAEQTSRSLNYQVPEGVKMRSDVSYEFYPVFGKTFADIIRSADENGPLDDRTKKRHLSAYRWSLGWQYKFTYHIESDEENNQTYVDIEIYDLNPSFNIIVTLPTLTDDSALNPIEKALWRQYFSTLLDYEHGHVKIIKDDSIQEINKKFSDINYLELDESDDKSIERAVELFVRNETAKIGSYIVKQIQRNEEVYNSTSGYREKLKSGIFPATSEFDKDNSITR